MCSEHTAKRKSNIFPETLREKREGQEQARRELERAGWCVAFCWEGKMDVVDENQSHHGMKTSSPVSCAVCCVVLLLSCCFATCMPFLSCRWVLATRLTSFSGAAVPDSN